MPYSRRAFSLIESAIVLGVVGLVIGGIWVAAAAVSENMKVSKTVAALMTIMENTRRLNAGYTPNRIAAAAGYGVGNGPSFDDVLAAANAIPTDVFNCSSGDCVGLWPDSGTRMYVFRRATEPGEYQLQFWTSSVSSCIKIGRAISAVKLDNYNVFSVQDGNGSYLYLKGYAPDFSLPTLTTSCRDYGSSYAIYFGP